MTYAQTLEYLYTTLPMFSRMGSAAYKKDLTNTRLLLDRLGHPEQRFRTIHVGGTNGKGSVSHMLAAVFQTAGYKTGLYTSPHLYDFRERIRINGAMCAESFVVDFVEQLREEMESIEPSFFEITVAMAFRYFAEQQVDIAIIEVGLGGRLDSTNVIIPELSVITNIGWDHMNLLGNTLPEIAGEKAGIIKPGVPAVIGERQPETATVFEAAAARCHSPLVFASDRYLAERLDRDAAPGRQQVQLHDRELEYQWQLELDLPGNYQLKNLCTAFAALNVLKSGWQLTEQQILTGLSEARRITGLSGRWEVLARSPMVVLEVAHNPDGIREMLRQISGMDYTTLHLVIGMVRDKDVDTILRLLPKEARYYFTQAGIPRALPVEELEMQADAHGLKGDRFPQVDAALAAAVGAAGVSDLIVVCGSIFLVAEVDRSKFQLT